MTELSLCLVFLLLGLVTGALGAWLIAKYRFAAQHISPEELQEKYVAREAFTALQQQADELRNDRNTRDEDIRSLEKALSAKDRDLLYLEEKLATWKADFNELQHKAHSEFENIASRLLEEKARKFTDQNTRQLNDLLHPLRDRIREFGQDIERRFTDEAKDKVSLRKEIDSLRLLNLQLSSDAQNLANALKGDAKFQGDWGEHQLEILLEKAGLVKDMHYVVQPSFKDENGQDKRPDFIIHLPEDKHLIVDSKVSLKAYEQYFQADNDETKAKHLQDHLASIRNHLRDLGGKNYQHLYDIHSPDYLLMFIPIEPAFSVAVQHDSKLFLDALDKNIVIVTTSTLLATMRTVSYIWRQERQKRNVLEIARQSGLLYDKFVGFVDDLKEIGQRLDHAQSAWNGAMNKLSESRKFGDTLIGRAERIRELGARASKNLPKELTGEWEEEQNGLHDEDGE